MAVTVEVLPDEIFKINNLTDSYVYNTIIKWFRILFPTQIPLEAFVFLEK